MAAEAGTFLIAAIIISQAAWSVAFHVGVFKEVSFDHFAAIWVSSLAALLATCFADFTSEEEAMFDLKGILILLLPSVWCVLELMAALGTTVWLDIIRLIVTVCTLALSVPYISKIILRSALPEIAEIHNPKLLRGLAVIAILIACIAYFIGAYHYLFLTCDDFGGNRPDNCFKADG